MKRLRFDLDALLRRSKDALERIRKAPPAPPGPLDAAGALEVEKLIARILAHGPRAEQEDETEIRRLRGRLLTLAKMGLLQAAIEAFNLVEGDRGDSDDRGR